MSGCSHGTSTLPCSTALKNRRSSRMKKRAMRKMSRTVKSDGTAFTMSSASPDIVASMNSRIDSPHGRVYGNRRRMKVTAKYVTNRPSATETSDTKMRQKSNRRDARSTSSGPHPRVTPAVRRRRSAAGRCGDGRGRSPAAGRRRGRAPGATAGGPSRAGRRHAPRAPRRAPALRLPHGAPRSRSSSVSPARLVNVQRGQHQHGRAARR